MPFPILELPLELQALVLEKFFEGSKVTLLLSSEATNQAVPETRLIQQPVPFEFQTVTATLPKHWKAQLVVEWDLHRLFVRQSPGLIVKWLRQHVRHITLTWPQDFFTSTLSMSDYDWSHVLEGFTQLQLVEVQLSRTYSFPQSFRPAHVRWQMAKGFHSGVTIYFTENAEPCLAAKCLPILKALETTSGLEGEVQTVETKHCSGRFRHLTFAGHLVSWICFLVKPLLLIMTTDTSSLCRRMNTD